MDFDFDNCRPKRRLSNLLVYVLGQPQNHQEAAFALAPSMLTHTPIGYVEKWVLAPRIGTFAFRVLVSRFCSHQTYKTYVIFGQGCLWVYIYTKNPKSNPYLNWFSRNPNPFRTCDFRPTNTKFDLVLVLSLLTTHLTN